MWLHVRPPDVSLVMFKDSMIHQGEPDARKVDHGDKGGITKRQLRTVVKVAQGLVRTPRICMVVRMALQLVQHQVADDLVGIP